MIAGVSEHVASGADAPPRLRMEGVTKAFPGVIANDKVSIDLRAGEIHTIVGENGAGKTTLMRILYGLNRPDGGRILIDGNETAIHNPRQALALGVNYVQQHFSLIPTLTVAENLVLALRTSQMPISLREAAARVQDLSQRYSLDVDAATPVHMLSVRMQQRTELLKALAREARILILDEPGAVLTPQEWTELTNVLFRLAQTGVAIFLISHKLEDVLKVSDRITVLRRGRVVATVAGREATKEGLAEMMIGSLGVRPSPRPTGVLAGVERIRVEDLWLVSDRGTWAVSGVSLSIRAGEVVGIAGLEGSGQVELTEAIAGARPIARGRIVVNGRQVPRWAAREARKRGIGHIPSDRNERGLVSTLSVAENLALPLASRPPLSHRGFLLVRRMKDYARALMARFNIHAPGPDAVTAGLSGGNQQRLILARELATDPPVLVCCYPTRGLDFAATVAIQQEIISRRHAGAAILYASVELDELLEVTDRIVVLHRGRITGEIPTRQATPEALGLLMGGAA